MPLRQDRVLGALLGMGIGDALGMPVEGWPRERVAERFGTIDQYHPRVFDDGAELKAGEFTDESEGVLCIVESFTANTGELDQENIRARLEILARGESRRWMHPATFAILEPDADGSQAAEAGKPAVTGDVAARGIALGLIAAGNRHPTQQEMNATSALLAGTTHPTAEAALAIEIVAEATRVIAAQEIVPGDLLVLIGSRYGGHPVADHLRLASDLHNRGAEYGAIVEAIGFGDAADQVVATAMLAAGNAVNFEEAVFLAASQGGAADARGAIAGALAGAAYGTAGIPQNLIDGLEGRVYIMLAAPWFFQTIQLKSSFWRSSN